MDRCYTFAGCRGRHYGAVVGVGGKFGDEGRRVDQGVPEGMVHAEGGQRRGGEYVSSGSISLEVVEMVPNDPLDVDAGGML
eukprot:g21389.t1